MSSNGDKRALSHQRQGRAQGAGRPGAAPQSLPIHSGFVTVCSEFKKRIWQTDGSIRKMDGEKKKPRIDAVMGDEDGRPALADFFFPPTVASRDCPFPKTA